MRWATKSETLADLVGGDLARDERGGDAAASSRESSLAGAADADQGAALLVHLHVVEGVKVGQEA